jgi:AraC family transcriptional regulator
MLPLNGVPHMQEYVAIPNTPDSVTCREPSVNALKKPAQRAVVPAWGVDAQESWPGSVNTEVTLDRLRVAVAEIFKAVSNVLQNERQSAKRCLQRATVILRTDPWFANAIEEAVLPSEERSKPFRGGLARWQIRRLTTHIEANLSARIPIKDLAVLVKLSPCHFTRVFRESFAETPHGYVLRRRVERAQGLMLTTDASLVQIAMDCGLADQTHLNKVFRRLVGESPGAWRRARANASTLSAAH